MRIFLLLTVLLLVPVCACTDDEGARRALENQGFTDIQIGGPAWMGCDEKDSFSNKFVAKNPQGKQVEGIVCCGVVKSCTIRW